MVRSGLKSGHSHLGRPAIGQAVLPGGSRESRRAWPIRGPRGGVAAERGAHEFQAQNLIEEDICESHC